MTTEAVTDMRQALGRVEAQASNFVADPGALESAFRKTANALSDLLDLCDASAEFNFATITVGEIRGAILSALAGESA